MNQSIYRKVELEQKSEAWYDFRNHRIGASDAAIISGLSPWKNSLTLWMEKLKKIEPPDFSANFAIQRGVRLEPLVLGMVNITLDRDFQPAVLASLERDHIIASYDCLDEEVNECGEIKVGNKKDHDKLYSADESTPHNIIIPKKYYTQVMQQMYVLGVDWSWFISYYLQKGEDDYKGDLRIVKVHRDQPFLERYLSVADEFYRCMKEDRAPEAVRLTL